MTAARYRERHGLQCIGGLWRGGQVVHRDRRVAVSLDDQFVAAKAI
jgi:hypothetical protein